MRGALIFAPPASGSRSLRPGGSGSRARPADLPAAERLASVLIEAVNTRVSSLAGFRCSRLTNPHATGASFVDRSTVDRSEVQAVPDASGWLLTWGR